MDALSKLFGGPARLKLLRLFLFNSDSVFTLDEVSSRTHVPKPAARREIALLLSIRVIKRKAQKGSKLAYTANQRFAHYGPLEVFLRTTTGITDSDIVDHFRKAGSLRVVTLTGLFTGTMEPKVDIIVVGDRMEEKKVAKAISALEAELGRELRYACFSTEDFRYRISVYDRLLRDVFDYSHRNILDKIGL